MKRFSLIVMVIGLILSLTAAPVLAETPDTEPDFTFSAISPKDRTIRNVTPKFYFTRYPGVTAYKLMVRDIFAGSFVYDDFIDSGNCGTAYCWLQPTTKLKTAQYPSSGGVFAWKVGAKVGTTWEWTPEVTFELWSKGFNSTFNTNTNKWMVLGGTWNRVDPGYYKTAGESGKFSSVLQKEYFVGQYVLEVRMKRKTETTDNRIYFEATPGTLNQGYWQHGYYFVHNNGATWKLVKVNNYAQTVLGSGTSPYLEPFDWNTIKLWVNPPRVYLWINGVYIDYVNTPDIASSPDSIGIGMFESNPDKSPLLIDYATLYYTSLMPDYVPLTADGEPNPAYLLNP